MAGVVPPFGLEVIMGPMILGKAIVVARHGLAEFRRRGPICGRRPVEEQKRAAEHRHPEEDLPRLSESQPVVTHMTEKSSLAWRNAVRQCGMNRGVVVDHLGALC